LLWVDKLTSQKMHKRWETEHK